MPIKFNFNFCDNSPECSGKAVCPTGAIYWDETTANALGSQGALRVDNGKCISCGKCVGDDGCPVGAIIFAKTDEELDSITKDIEIDVDKVKALFVDRYGAEPIDTEKCVSADELMVAIESTGVTLVEDFADWSIQCLLTSIPIDSLMRKLQIFARTDDVQYIKCDQTEAKTEEDTLPCLRVYRDGAYIGQIDGYFHNSQEQELFASLEKMFA